MLKNHRLANAIADCGFFEFRRQLEYKCAWYGSKLTVVDRFYPSSQICSNCGHRQKMPLKERVYNCSHCGTSIDRDLNASLNLLNCASTPSSGGIDACGEVTPLESVAFETWMKQEASMSLFDLAV
ncbi:MAG: RNA-guided endonuclease InsQ/TnpB family protein [Pseudanabaenaceae cyanobacterium]